MITFKYFADGDDNDVNDDDDDVLPLGQEEVAWKSVPLFANADVQGLTS